MSTEAGLVEVHAPDSLVPAAADAIGDAVRDAVESTGRCRLALAGGTTPRPIYAELAGLDVPWEHVHVYFGDERAVGPAHPRSNYGTAFRWLLRHVPVPPQHVHRPRAEWADLARAARAYEEELPDALDVLLLGLGVDGHVASLFPGSPVLAEEGHLVAPTLAPVSGERRLTLTPKAIRLAHEVIVLVRGADKAQAVRHALAVDGSVDSCPARLVADATWILDTDAATLLEVTGPRRE